MDDKAKREKDSYMAIVGKEVGYKQQPEEGQVRQERDRIKEEEILEGR